MQKKTSEKNEEMHYSFILFVVRDGDNSERARKNLRHLCRKWLPDRHTIKEVDVVDDFQTALEHNILLTPSVVVTEPKPRVVIHGDLSDSDKFLNVLNINEEADEQ